MEEVDGIVLVSLRQLGVPLPENITSLRQFDTQTLFQSVVAYMKVIDPDKKLPDNLPKETAKGYRVGENLARTIKDMGYPNELGFDQFLYPNEVDVRKLLMFLMELVPHEEEEEREVLDARGLLRQSIHDGLKAWQGKPFIPPLLSEKRARHQLGTTRVCLPDSSKGKREYHRDHMLLVTSQVRSPSNVLSSILQLSSLEHLLVEQQHSNQFDSDQKRQPPSIRVDLKGQGEDAEGNKKDDLLSLGEFVQQAFGHRKGVAGTERATAFENATTFGDTQAAPSLPTAAEPEQEKDEEDKPDPVAIARQKQEELQQELDQVAEQCASLEENLIIMAQTRTQLQGQLDEEERKKDSLEDEYRSQKASLDMLGDFENNLAKLQQITVESGQRLVALAEEWEKHRQPMLQVYRENKKKLSQRKMDCRQKLEQIKGMRLEMKQMIQQLQEKDGQTAKMKKDYERMPKGVNRNSYTVRILEIVKNVKKQRVDINSILRDIRDVQKEISMCEQTLKRSYGDADETVFRMAKKDKDLKPAYKLFVDLHTDFSALIESVEAKGKATSEIRQLELKTDAIAQQNHSLNFDKINQDLANVRKENERLQSALANQ